MKSVYPEQSSSLSSLQQQRASPTGSSRTWQPTRNPGLQPTIARRDAAAVVTITTTETGPRRHVLVGGQAVADGTALTVTELIEGQRVWRLAPLNVGRIGCGVALLRGDDKDDNNENINNHTSLYCVGGLSSTTDTPPTVLASVERLANLPSGGVWETIPSSLGTPRWGAAVVTLLHDKYLFVLGGRNAAWREMSSGEVGILRPPTDDDCNQQQEDKKEDKTTTTTTQNMVLEFSKMPYALKTKRFAAAAVQLTEYTFLVLGGFTGKEWTDTCCIYDISENPNDPKDGQWRDTKKPMAMAVQYPQATIVGGNSSGSDNHSNDSDDKRMVVVTGAAVDGSGACLQVFSIQKEEWTVVSDHDTGDGWMGTETLLSTETHLMAWGSDTVYTRDLQTFPLMADEPDSDILVVNDAVAIAVGSTNSQGSTRSHNVKASVATNGHSHVPVATATATSPLRTVKDQECFVEGELARYTGPLNEQGHRHGRGFLIWADDQNRFYPKELSKNTYYEGEFVNDSRIGEGTMFFDKEDRVYRGNFARGVLNGPDGTLFDGRRGLEYTGAFRKGTPHGQGQCTYNQTKQTFKGLWKSGKPYQGEWRDAHGNLLQSGMGPWAPDLAVD